MAMSLLMTSATVSQENLCNKGCVRGKFGVAGIGMCIDSVESLGN